HPPAHLLRDHGEGVQRHREDHPGSGHVNRRGSLSSVAGADAAGATSRTDDTAGRRTMRLNVVGATMIAFLLIALVGAYSTLFTVYQTRQALVVRLGQPIRTITEPGLNWKYPLGDSVLHIDKR